MPLGIVMLSGGMDSTTLAYCLRDKYHDFDWHYLSFDYGQRHSKEIAYAYNTAFKLHGRYNVINLMGMSQLLAQSGSVLVDQLKKVPDGHYAEESMKQTVVPNRNSIMLAIAVGVAVAENAEFVAAAMHAGDHFIYPDCRPAFIDAFERAELLANEGFWDGQILTPFINETKADIARHGDQLGVDWRETWSCYKGLDFHCGTCGTCNERKEAFELAGITDPTEYME